MSQDRLPERLRLELAQDLQAAAETHFSELFDHGSGKGNYADVLITNTKPNTSKNKSQTWSAHSIILYRRCPVFAIVPYTSNITVDLSESSHQAVACFLEYLYTFSRHIARICYNGKGNGVENLMNLARMAEKYEQPLLLDQILHFFNIDEASGGPRTTDLLRALQAAHKMSESGPKNVKAAVKESEFQYSGEASKVKQRLQHHIELALTSHNRLCIIDPDTEFVLRQDTQLACSLIKTFASALTSSKTAS